VRVIGKGNAAYVEGKTGVGDMVIQLGLGGQEATEGGASRSEGGLQKSHNERGGHEGTQTCSPSGKIPGGRTLSSHGVKVEPAPAEGDKRVKVKK